MTAQREIELAAVRAEALYVAELAELSRENKVLDVSGPSPLAEMLRGLVAAPLAEEQDSGGKSSAGAAGHGDAVIGGVGDAAIPGNAIPT